MERLPTAADFNARRVTNPNQSEIVRQRFYDYQLYATAGTTQLTFFSAPVGQGVTTALGGTAGTAKTLWDTNLELPNTLPSGKAFMIESIEVLSSQVRCQRRTPTRLLRLRCSMQPQPQRCRRSLPMSIRFISQAC